ncbi:TLD family protein [Tritrichomonas foetus]|uniref:TLD family protein n=1 Tax=Tritrichomonas foetus TaxID=1144522 RepID=A0A1J4JGA8_9EUKA|nr:TLD family protein [Tritrichomonas foetus]|eukprot:OHS98216.1 TLD family protein [Tritrichomonas foetus]
MNDIDINSIEEHGLMPFSMAIDSNDWKEEENIRVSHFHSLSKNIEKVSPKQLKKKFREGIPSIYRRKFWFLASGGYDLMVESGVMYEQITSIAFKTEPTIADFFGLPPDFFSFMPNSHAEKLVNFLHVVRFQNRMIEFAPLIPSVSAVLLLYMEPSLAYFTIQSMINKSRDTDWYFKDTKSSFQATIETTDILINRKCHHLVQHAKSIGLNIVEICLFLFPMFLVPILSLPIMLSLFDTFILEGRKILIRVCVAIFEIEEKSLLSTETPDEFIHVLLTKLSQLETVKDLKKLLNHSFSIHLSRKRDILPLEKKYKNKNDLDFSHINITKMNLKSHFPVPVDYESTISVIDRIKGIMLPKQIDFSKQTLLTLENYCLVQQFLPHNLKSKAPILIFDMSIDGTVLSSLIRQASHDSFYILLIKTNSRIFGALLSCALIVQDTKNKYIGNQNTMVFDFTNKKAYRHYPLVNELFISISSNLLIIGGPHFSIYLEEGLSKVGSQPCETFDSPSFVESSTGDKILNIQMFKLSE